MSEAQRIADELDEWCKRRIARLEEPMSRHVMERNDPELSDPNYRVMLGQSQAYSAMRSFIHGSLQQKEPLK